MRQGLDYRAKIAIPLDQYKQALDDFFDKHYPQETQRRVFLATENKKPLEYFSRLNDPRYTIIHQDPEVIRRGASSMHSHGEDTLFALIVDMYLLIHADGMMTSLDSNMGRMLYELRAASWYHDVVNTSLSIEGDLGKVMSYFLAGKNAAMLVIKDFTGSKGPQDLQDLRVGDLVIDEPLYYDWHKRSQSLIYSRGTKVGTEETGRYPVSCVVPFPMEALKYMIPKEMLTWED